MRLNSNSFFVSSIKNKELKIKSRILNIYRQTFTEKLGEIQKILVEVEFIFLFAHEVLNDTRGILSTLA